ncbi:hypothetical protein BGZ54_002555 [Gamsiella multidivaricata]|nr:hypothetical protein BGZ54_002555 [Gamsiella multidivaricata]
MVSQPCDDQDHDQTGQIYEGGHGSVEDVKTARDPDIVYKGHGSPFARSSTPSLLSFTLPSEDPTETLLRDSPSQSSLDPGGTSIGIGIGINIIHHQRHYRPEEGNPTEDEFPDPHTSSSAPDASVKREEGEEEGAEPRNATGGTLLYTTLSLQTTASTHDDGPYGGDEPYREASTNDTIGQANMITVENPDVEAQGDDIQGGGQQATQGAVDRGSQKPLELKTEPSDDAYCFNRISDGASVTHGRGGHDTGSTTVEANQGRALRRSERQRRIQVTMTTSRSK